MTSHNDPHHSILSCTPSFHSGKMKSHCSNQSLPSDLMPEVFVNLPVKSLVRMSCSSKSCLCCVKCPEFAMKHLATRSSTSSPCIIDYVPTMDSSKLVTLKINIFSLTKTKTLHLEARFEVGSARTVLVSNYCHGVTCMYLFKIIGGEKMVLFNPAIREVVEVPLTHRISTYGLAQFGIGFDSMSNDYKIMTITAMSDLEVYSVKKGTWNKISYGAYTLLSRFVPVLNAKGRILNLMGSYELPETYGVLSFDVVEERIWFTRLPQCSCPSIQNHRLLPSSNWQAVQCCSSPGFNGNGAIDIWVLDEHINVSDDHHEAIWSKHASIVIPIERYLVSLVEVWMNDEEVFLHLKKKEECHLHSAEMFVYNLANKELKLIQALKPIGEGSFYIADVYMESLISIKSLIPAHKQEALAKQFGEKKKGSVCFIREILGENRVGWSHMFELDIPSVSRQYFFM